MKSKNLFSTKGFFTLLLSVFAFSISAQNVTVSGTVTDDTGLEVIGATVIVAGDASRGTVTDFDGKYTLNNVPSNGSLQISYVGMVTQTIPVNGRTTIDVVLTSDSELLDEVVVTALGMKRQQKALGYAMKELKGDELISNIINPVAALQGKVAGVEIAQSDGGMFGSTKILIRGASTLGSLSLINHFYQVASCNLCLKNILRTKSKNFLTSFSIIFFKFQAVAAIKALICMPFSPHK